MDTDWFKTFIDHLRSLVKEAPYMIFIFISPIFLLIGLIWQKYFYLFVVFFLYSVVGIIWRHAVKDFRGRIKEVYEKLPEKYNKINLWLTGVYQLVNLVFVIILVVIVTLFAKGNT